MLTGMKGLCSIYLLKILSDIIFKLYLLQAGAFDPFLYRYNFLEIPKKLILDP